jgi:hypothetical protein
MSLSPARTLYSRFNSRNMARIIWMGLFWGGQSGMLLPLLDGERGRDLGLVVWMLWDELDLWVE